jgi:aflatoxin B1 aldehyde reductase
MNRPHLSFGCANLGIAWTTDRDIENLAEALRRCGIEHIDTAARYPPNAPGLAEKLLGDGGFLSNKGFKVATKISVKAWDGGGSMAEEAVDASIGKSLKALRGTKVHTTLSAESPVEI